MDATLNGRLEELGVKIHKSCSIREPFAERIHYSGFDQGRSIEEYAINWKLDKLFLIRNADQSINEAKFDNLKDAIDFVEGLNE